MITVNLRLGPRRTAAGIAAGVLVVTSVVAVRSELPTGHAARPVGRHVALLASTCGGPSGAAYVADAGYQGFTAIDTANCAVVQTYNVDDPQVPGDPGDYNYSGTDEGIALDDGTLWFAVAGTSNVAAIATSKLVSTDYNPPETLVRVGLIPQELAVSPNGRQVWVADTGPQTTTSSVSGLAVIDTSTDKVVSNMRLQGDPTDVAFAPSGDRAYVTTSKGLFVYNTDSRRLVAEVRGLGEPESVAVAPDGKAIYVTETSEGRLAKIGARTDRVASTTGVGQLPWQAVVSPDSSTVYVADPDSDAVSVVRAATGKLRATLSVAGDPDAVGLTPDGSELWVGDNTNGSVTVLDTSDGAIVGQVNLGGHGPQSGDGLEPTGIVLTTTPTAGS